MCVFSLLKQVGQRQARVVLARFELVEYLNKLPVSWSEYVARSRSLTALTGVPSPDQSAADSRCTLPAETRTILAIRYAFFLAMYPID
eukprot:9111352-Pyramimonas_sp.AAC.1